MSQSKQSKPKTKKSEAECAEESAECDVIAIQDFVQKLGGIEKAKLALATLNRLQKAA